MALDIGNWVRLNTPGRKWHLVESVVAGDAITRCGRRLPDPTFSTSTTIVLTRAPGQPQNCRYCDREITAPEPAEVSEDDGSTANEVADS